MNTINLGIIMTPLGKDKLIGPRGADYRRMIELSDAGRAGTPDEVAAVAALLVGRDRGSSPATTSERVNRSSRAPCGNVSLPPGRSRKDVRGQSVNLAPVTAIVQLTPPHSLEPDLSPPPRSERVLVISLALTPLRNRASSHRNAVSPVRAALCVAGFSESCLLVPKSAVSGMANQNEIRSRSRVFLFPKVEQPTSGDVASFPAMFMVQNNQRFYLASLPVEDIFPYCFVTRRIDDPQEGFQRTLSGERADDIAQYLDNSKGSIPTNVVLSAQPEAELVYLRGSKTIKYKRRPKSFLVIDGQHRLFGYGRTQKKHRVPVAIYEGLTRKDEASLFIDINTNQRGVPAALLLDIKQVAEQESFVEMHLRTVFDKLNKDPESPLNGFLSPSASVAGKLSRVTFNRAMRDVVENPVVGKLSDDKQYLLIRNYFRAVESVLSKPKLMFKSVYFESFCALFAEVLRLSYAKHRDYKDASLRDVVAPLSNVDITGVMAGGKTKITKSAILPVLQHTISGQIATSDDMV